MNKHSVRADESAGDRTRITAIRVTTLTAMLLTAFGMLLGWAVWMIALIIVVACLPLFGAKILWSNKQYGYVMLLLVCLLVQVGRVGDDTLRMFQPLIFSSVDNHNSISLLQQLIADVFLLAGLVVAHLHFQSARNRWLTYSVGTALLALVTDALLPGQFLVVTSAQILILATLLLTLIQQVNRIYDAWLTQAITSLNEGQLVAAMERVKRVELHSNRVIFRQNDAADQIYFIQHGQVEVLRRERKGVYEPIAMLGPGQFFGEIGVLQSTRRTAAVKAATKVSLLALDHKTVTTLLSTASSASWNDDAILRHRLVQLGVQQRPAVESTLGTFAY